jgi:hypothetical protein
MLDPDADYLTEIFHKFSQFIQENDVICLEEVTTTSFQILPSLFSTILQFNFVGL